MTKSLPLKEFRERHCLVVLVQVVPPWSILWCHCKAGKTCCFDHHNRNHLRGGRGDGWCRERVIGVDSLDCLIKEIEERECQKFVEQTKHTEVVGEGGGEILTFQRINWKRYKRTYRRRRWALPRQQITSLKISRVLMPRSSLLAFRCSSCKYLYFFSFL